MTMTTKYTTVAARCARAMACLALLFCSLGALSACAGAQVDAEETIATLGPDDKIYEYRTVARQLRAHPLAAEVARDLDQVDVWLTRAERMIADDEDDELLDLQLMAIEGQLVKARSLLSRREAEEQLESSRSSYETRMDKITTQREQNAAQMGRQGGEVSR